MTASSLNREFSGALVEELAIVVGAMIDAAASVVPGAPAMGRQWVAEIRAEGGLDGTITLVLDYDGAVAVTKLMTGIEGEVPTEASARHAARSAGAGSQRAGAQAGRPRREVERRALDEQSDLVPEGEWGAHAIAAEKLPTAAVADRLGRGVVPQATGAGGRAGASRYLRPHLRPRRHQRRIVASRCSSTSISRSSCDSAGPRCRCDS